MDIGSDKESDDIGDAKSYNQKVLDSQSKEE
jgi:hypothetical protein